MSKLTEQFYRTILAEIARVPDEKWKSHSRIPVLLDKLSEDSKKNWSSKSGDPWNKMYEVEQHLVQLFEPATLNVELERRLVEARLNLASEKAEYYEHEVNSLQEGDAASPEDARDIERKRALLGRMVNDLQWTYMNRDVVREYSRKARIRTSLTFFGTLLVFFVALVLYLYCRNDYLILLLVASTAGLFGASFSMLVGLKKQLEKGGRDDLKVIIRFAYLFSRCMIGLGAALIILFFMVAGLLSGEVFPDLGSWHKSQQALSDSFPDLAKQIKTQYGEQENNPALADQNYRLNERIEQLLELHRNATALDPKNLALLILWCFVAGFSEKLVPNLIARQADRVPTLKTTKEKE